MQRQTGDQKDVAWFREQSERARKQKLGQVNTPPAIAEFMVALALLGRPESIMEPCFGEGVLLEALIRSGFPCERIVGVEVDPDLYHAVAMRFPTLGLLNGDFLQSTLSVDCIVMNPPYVRQELLTAAMPRFLRKSWLQRLSADGDIPLRSNLYVYFLLKAWSVLKAGGHAVVIVSNTWMTAAYGSGLRRFLSDRFHIRAVIQFGYDVFPNADVDSCILHLVKHPAAAVSPDASRLATDFVAIEGAMTSDRAAKLAARIDNGGGWQHEEAGVQIRRVAQSQLAQQSNWLRWFQRAPYFSGSNTTTLGKVAKTRRGITTNFNHFFVVSDEELTASHPEFFSPVICSPKEVRGYSTGQARMVHQLFLTKAGKDQLPEALRSYVLEIERKITATGLPSTVAAEIARHPETWFHIKPRCSAPLLFSYMVRKNKRFLYNNGRYLALDNFYELTPLEDVDGRALFALLNSSATALQVELLGRSHGRGMLKIQKYELAELVIVDPARLAESDRQILVRCADQLLDADAASPDVIATIDEHLLPYVSDGLSREDLLRALAEAEQGRSQRRPQRRDAHIGHIRWDDDATDGIEELDLGPLQD